MLPFSVCRTVGCFCGNDKNVYLCKAKNLINKDMATVTLDLQMEQEVVERVKKYAAQHRISVSSIAQNLFTVITHNTATDHIEVRPLVKSFSIDRVDVPKGFDYKQALAEARNEKYL
jgi:hypothetical protein